MPSVFLANSIHVPWFKVSSINLSLYFLMLLVFLWFMILYNSTVFISLRIVFNTIPLSFLVRSFVAVESVQLFSLSVFPSTYSANSRTT